METQMTEKGNYGNKVEMLINSPKNCGEITPDEVKELKATLFIHEYGSEEIGEHITLQWAVDPSDDAIRAGTLYPVWITCRHRRQRHGSPALPQQDCRQSRRDHL